LRAFDSPSDVWFLAHFWSLSIEESSICSGCGAHISIKTGSGAPCFASSLVQSPYLSIEVCALCDWDEYDAPISRLRHAGRRIIDWVFTLIGFALALRSGIYRETSNLVQLYELGDICRDGLSVSSGSGILYFGGFTLIALAAALIVLHSYPSPSRALIHPIFCGLVGGLTGSTFGTGLL